MENVTKQGKSRTKQWVKKLRKRDLFLPTVIFVLISVILSGLFFMVRRQTVAETRERCEYMAANQAGIMKNSVDIVLARAYTLSALIQNSGGSTDFFRQVAESIYEEAGSEAGVELKNIAIAPGGVVEQVYPLEGNETLVGFDFMDESMAGNEEAIAAYRQGELVVTAPFELVQGGTGMAGRLPVFLEENGEKVFWGLVTVTMDFERLLASFGLDNLIDMGMEYELWYYDAEGQKVTLASSGAELNTPASCKFELRNLTWQLDLVPKEGWSDCVELMLVLGVILAIALLGGLLMLDKIKLNRANETLERLANLDSLTQCHSRHYVNTVLVNQRTGQWNDPHARYSLAIIDIDYFKQINDTWGHEIGDRAIVAVAQVLVDSCKPANGDCVVRHGGDEFIVLFNDVTGERFADKLNYIVEGIRNLKFNDYPDMHLSVSVGGEPFISPEQSTYYDMVGRADKKLYEAKENGRDQYRV